MANRFTGRIRRGEIASVEELKSEFKALAKEVHPDLQGPGASGEDFASLRSEYEAALRDFDRHRFGLGSGRKAGLDGSGNPARRPVYDRRRLYSALAALRRRGFPKLPRHDKERMRYEYARFVFLAALSAWDESRLVPFRGFEAAALDAAAGIGAAGQDIRALAVLDAVIAWHSRSGAHERRRIELELEALSLSREAGGERRGAATELAAEGDGSPFVAFLELLVKDMEKGPALAGRARD